MRTRFLGPSSFNKDFGSYWEWSRSYKKVLTFHHRLQKGLLGEGGRSREVLEMATRQTAQTGASAGMNGSRKESVRLQK